MAKTEKRNRRLEKFWQSVFDRSRVNGADYRGEHLPLHTWLWPTGTFFQRRLQELRSRQLDELTNNKSGEEGKELAATRAEAEQPELFPLREALTPARVSDRPVQSGAGASSYQGEKPNAVASEGLIAVDFAQLGKKTSPTQALLSLEREGWARVKDGEVRPVEIDEKSVQAALHKENLEKFQSALVQSGEWIRVNRSDSEQAPVAKQNKVDKSLEAAPAKAEAVKPAPAPVSTAPAAPAVALAPTRIVDGDPALQAVKEKPENCPHSALASHDEWWQLTHEKSDQAEPQEFDWQDIDEKLLWLAKPSS